ncbi:hypothetical protein BD311DRAFT_673159 [Dichomitus squalens]|uniref:Uncharacterized protein n=1 Tax=Dichomitus squalens TaxID=114155 RepID=A0A4Q9MCS8_9APHY|nr:hypothetical protein BD311DRAFT_673159 [Dichomitus squalens]
MIGESPCVTYQRLRQICNQDYQVPNFKSSVPGDVCADQISDCCCNTIAYQLSMLCMNCQWDTQPGTQIGYDAPVGTYTIYQNKCGAGTNNSLSTNIQLAVCNENIRLANFLYQAWDTGDCIYSRERAGLEAAQYNNNIFTHCPNQIITVSTPTSTSNPMSGGPVAEPTTTTTNATSNSPSGDAAPSGGDNERHSNNNSHANVGAIVGGVVGAVGAVAIIGGLIVFCRRRKHRHGSWDRESPTAQRHYSYGYQDSLPIGSRAALATSMPVGEPIGGGFGEQAPSANGSVAPGLLSSRSVVSSRPGWTGGDRSVNARTALSREGSSRHVPVSPALEGFRGNPDRSPPAYGSWQSAMADSNPPNPPISSTLGSNVNAPLSTVGPEPPSIVQSLVEK